MAWMTLVALGKAMARDQMRDSDLLRASTDRVIRALPRARVGFPLTPIREGEISNSELRPVLFGMAQDFFRAIQFGRVVDLGDVPKANLQAAHAIGKDLLDTQAVRQPFTSSWILYLTMQNQEG